MGKIDDVLNQLGIVLPPAPKPVGAYVPFVRTGNLVFVSGQLPLQQGKVVFTGKVGTQLTIEQGQEAAKMASINALAILKEACGGNLDSVVRIVRLGVFVQNESDFTQQPAVANGASELLVAVFGDAGRHARAAVGTNSLPLGAAVELEVIAEVKI